MRADLLQQDLQHVWHPCTQMHDFEQYPPLIIKAAQGSYIELNNGHKIIDGIASWWCKSLGHSHPRLQTAITKQLQHYEHIITANTCQEKLVLLSEKLATLDPNLTKAFYASDGSSAVEIALKMVMQARNICGGHHRKKFLALKNSYHGETLLTMSISDLGLYRDPFKDYLLPAEFLQGIPYVSSVDEALWQDCHHIWPAIEKQLNQYAHELSAIIIEPVVQGAAGMLIYSQDFLQRLRQWTHENNIYLIADEIMTGFGRTGKALACQHANISPDFICLGKALTAGYLPMSAVVTSKTIYDIFYDDYVTGKAFLHSHTYSGNALAAAVALEALNIYEEENIYQYAFEKQTYLRKLLQDIAKQTKCLKNIRGIGMIIAADLILDESQKNQRLAFKICQEAIKLGALLRPLGNSIYWCPPLNITDDDLEKLAEITCEAIKCVMDT